MYKGCIVALKREININIDNVYVRKVSIGLEITPECCIIKICLPGPWLHCYGNTDAECRRLQAFAWQHLLS